MLRKYGIVPVIFLSVVISLQLCNCRSEKSQSLKTTGSWELPVLVNHGKAEIPGVSIKMPEYIQKTDAKAVLLHFNATWNHPLEQTIPYLQDFYNQYKEKGFRVICIYIDETASQQETIKKTILEMVREDGSPANITFPVCWDVDQDVIASYEITSLYTNLLLDNENKIIYRQSGFSMELMKELDAEIQKLFNEE